jgi:hypothetical protein
MISVFRISAFLFPEPPTDGLGKAKKRKAESENWRRSIKRTAMISAFRFHFFRFSLS